MTQAPNENQSAGTATTAPPADHNPHANPSRDAIGAQEAFQRALAQPRPPHEFNDPDDLAGDPIRDRPPQTRSKGKVDRLMRLLDSLECENPNRRWKR